MKVVIDYGEDFDYFHKWKKEFRVEAVPLEDFIKYQIAWTDPQFETLRNSYAWAFPVRAIDRNDGQCYASLSFEKHDNTLKIYYRKLHS
jgi:hypothetical protein